jgi:hypothetical protein
VLLCELLSHPFVNMGICDDWPYILSAQKLASTGHIAYNGWAAPMLGWQLYLGAAFIKLFGFSFTTVRMSTLLVAIVMAFVLQRILVRAGINERNATIGTLVLVLSPLYLMLSVTFMTDIFGLFAIVLCLYGCLRAIQSPTSSATIGWLCFAVATNAICGTSRQIAWLGVLVMVPSALWLLRAQRRVLLAGATANLAGALFILACMLWFKQQPYTIPEHLLPTTFPLLQVFTQLLYACLDIPFLLFPIAILFLPEIRKSRPRVLIPLLLAYLVIAVHPRHAHQIFLLEPMLGYWDNMHGIYVTVPQGIIPAIPHTVAQVLLTIATIGGLIGLIASFFSSRRTPPAADFATGDSSAISWKQLGVLLVPFSLAYTLLLIPRATTIGIYARYLPELLVIVLLCLVRYYQNRIQPRLPLAGVLMVGVMAIYSIAMTHDLFSLYRARVAIAAEIRAGGVPDTSVDNGWEYNLGVELHHAPSINDPAIVVPAHAYVPMPPPPADTCTLYWYDRFPHIHPLYGISFDPNACNGPAPFAPMQYSRWLASSPGTLYVVNYTAPSKQ